MASGRPDESVATATKTGLSVGGVVESVRIILEDGGVGDAAVEARDLVAAVAGQPRFWPRFEAQSDAGPGLLEGAVAAARKRAGGAPFAYAVGRAAFRHLVLEVDDRVLIPRAETEVLVDLVLQHRRGLAGGVAADVGTGSGAIALALASEGRFDRIIATDIDSGALRRARSNAAHLDHEARSRVEFRAGDLLAPLAGERLDCIVSNPPYIAHKEAAELPPSVRDWEPVHALLSAGNGLEHARRLIEGGHSLLSSGGLLAMEVDSRRASAVANMALSRGNYCRVRTEKDLTGRDRFVLAERV